MLNPTLPAAMDSPHPLLPAHALRTVPDEVPAPVLDFTRSLPVNFAFVRWWLSCNRAFCIYCHARLDNNTRTRDHLVSRATMRAHDFSERFIGKFHEMNVAPCCTVCNQAKGSLSAHEWPALRELPGGRYLLLR